MNIRFLVVSPAYLILWSNLTVSDGLVDLLKKATEEYLRDKAGEAELVPERKQEVNFTFMGVTAAPSNGVCAAQVSTNLGAQTVVEQDCSNWIHNKIAWSSSGQKIRPRFNIKALCKAQLTYLAA